MKPSTIALATLAMFALGAGGPVLADPIPPAVLGSNYSSATQNGGSNHATIDQTVGPHSVGNASTIEQIGTNNHVRGVTFTDLSKYEVLMDAGTPSRPIFSSVQTGVIQDGTNGTLNNSLIKQETWTGGAVNGNEATVVQDGSQNTNTAKISQQSDSNNAGIFQGMNGGHGKTNLADITQQGSSSGTGNLAWITQDGAGDVFNKNDAVINQSGNSNDAFIHQGGNYSDNKATIEQTGTSQKANITQGDDTNSNQGFIFQESGDGNDAEITQQGTHNQNYAKITQNGTDHDAVVLQEGTNLNNTALITQTGNGNYANVYQH